MDHDGDIPMPINSSYGGHAHVVHHHHDPHIILPVAAPCPPPRTQTHHDIHIPSSNGNGNGGGGDEHHHHKKATAAATHHHVVGGVRYRECLKNHAAAMGGNATDGCGEFMPSGEEGSMEAHTCSACNCHRNFHRKEIEGEPPTDHFYQYRLGRSKVILAAGGHHHPHNTSNMLLPPPPEAFGYPTPAAGGTLIHSRAGGGITSHGGQMIMSYNMQQAVSAESDDREEEHEDRYGRHHDDRQVGKMKKRFRTKFTQEQKEKMLNFAERVGWKIQKQEEGVVQQLCQELGIKRRVLKVWMHNNKHNLATKNMLPTTTPAAAAADGQLA